MGVVYRYFVGLGSLVSLVVCLVGFFLNKCCK